MINCPWCGEAQEHTLRNTGVNDITCNGGTTPTSSASRWCNRPIRLLLDKSGRVKQLERLSDNKSYIVIDAGYSAQSTRGVTTNEIYEETMRIIEASMNVSEDRKEQAQDVLKYVKEYSPYFLPVVADGIKKVFYL